MPLKETRPADRANPLQIFLMCVIFSFPFLNASYADTTIFAIYNIPAGQYSFAKKLSLNAVVIWPVKEQLNEAQRLGLRALVNIAPGHFPDTAAWQKKIREVKSHPAVFAWILYDEPDLNRKPVAEVAWAYRTMKSIDPVHPVYQTIWNPMRYAEYAPYCDILAVLPYVVTKKEPLTEDDFMRVHQFVSLGKRMMKNKPVYVVVQSFAGLPAWPRPPTPKELSTIVAVASAAGARGYAFYAYTSAEPYPSLESKTRFFLMNDTPLMESIRSSISALK